MTSRVVEGALEPTDLLLGTEDPASGALVAVTASRDGGEPAPGDGDAGPGTAGAGDAETGSSPATRGAADVDAALEGLEEEAVGRFDVRRCRLRVRTDAPAGEPAAVAVVRAPHRRAAFEAARWAVASALERIPGRGGP